MKVVKENICLKNEMKSGKISKYFVEKDIWLEASQSSVRLHAAEFWTSALASDAADHFVCTSF